MAKYTNLTSLLKAIADSIRNKKGTSVTINAQDFPSEIDGIVLGSGNATVGDVLVGKTFSNDDGAQTGTMVNNGAVSKSLGFGENYTIPQGYHNGSGKVSAKAPSGTISITSNGTKDVTNYASASVNVQTSQSITNFTAYPSVPNTYDKSNIIIILMLPITITSLLVHAYQWNAEGSTLSWPINVRVRRSGTSTWDTLDSSTISINSSSGSTYNKTLTPSSSYKYDAVSFDSVDPKRLSDSYITVSGNT